MLKNVSREKKNSGRAGIAAATVMLAVLCVCLVLFLRVRSEVSAMRADLDAMREESASRIRTERELQDQTEEMKSKLATLEEEMKDKEELYRLWERKEQQLRELLG